MVPGPGAVHQPSWAPVTRPSIAVLLLLCAGCGLDAPSSGVAVIDSNVSAAAEIEIAAPPPTIEVTLPPVLLDPEPTPDDDETIVEPPAPRPSSVAVVGDSLTVSAADEIEVALAAIGLDVLVIDAKESRRTTRGSTNLSSGAEAVESILSETSPGAEPGLWVIALGTNDVASVGSLDGFGPEMRELLALIPDDAPVIWVDLWIRDRAEAIAQANLMIRAELRDRDGGSAVVDWFAHGDDEGVITGDGVHLTEAGQLLFATSIADTVDEMFPRDP